MEHIVEDLQNYNETTLAYHWYDFEHQNQIILRMLQEATSSNNGLNYSVIPAYHMNMRRPDLHRTHQQDCLHNCYPGKMDVYSQMLLHLMHRERTPDIVAEHEHKYREAYVRYREKQQQQDQQLQDELSQSTEEQVAAMSE
jgi:hypothetical protein